MMGNLVRCRVGMISWNHKEMQRVLDTFTLSGCSMYQNGQNHQRLAQFHVVRMASAAREILKNGPGQLHLMTKLNPILYLELFEPQIQPSLNIQDTRSHRLLCFFKGGRSSSVVLLPGRALGTVQDLPLPPGRLDIIHKISFW